MRGGTGANRERAAAGGREGGDGESWEDPGGASPQPHAEDRLLAEAVDRWVERRLDALREEAETVRAQFESRLRAEGQTRHRSEWGRVGLRVREQPSPPATPGAFTVEWCTYSFGNRAGGKACFTNYIPKGDGDRYPRSAFRGKLRNWQRPIVDDAETRFASIRRAARHVAQVRTQLRMAMRVERAALDALPASGEIREDRFFPSRAQRSGPGPFSA